jgi:hypothetical protein
MTVGLFGTDLSPTHSLSSDAQALDTCADTRQAPIKHLPHTEARPLRVAQSRLRQPYMHPSMDSQTSHSMHRMLDIHKLQFVNPSAHARLRIPCAVINECPTKGEHRLQ